MPLWFARALGQDRVTSRDADSGSGSTPEPASLILSSERFFNAQRSLTSRKAKITLARSVKPQTQLKLFSIDPPNSFLNKLIFNFSASSLPMYQPPKSYVSRPASLKRRMSLHTA